MQFININILSIFVFIILFGIIVFLAYLKLYSQINFNNQFKLLKSPANFYVKYIFLFLSLFVLLFSILGPRYGLNSDSVGSEGIDVMFVLDVSKSMNVADISDGHYNYTRLDIAKKAIGDYVVKHDNNRYGLVIFAGDAISTIPLTNDYNLFLTMLSGVDYRNLTVQGSDFKKALDLAINRFVGDKDRSKALVFISDGGDSGDKIDIPDNIKKDIVYYVVGVGTDTGGKIIKGTDVFGRPIYQKYKGQFVVSRLNTNNLKQLSSLLNGEFFRLEDVGDLKNLDKKLSLLKTKAIKKKNIKELNNFSRVLSILSLFLFILFLIFYIKPDLLKLGRK